MGPWARALTAGALLAIAAVPFAPEARAESHKDEKLGYSFNYPQRWDTVPVDVGGHLAAKFQSNRKYEYNDPKGNFWWHHQPYIEVVVIPYAAKDNKGVTVENTDKGIKLTQNAPWKDVKEYMDKTFQDRRIGGFHFSGEEAATVNGLKVRQLEITVDKLVQGERRIYGWEFAAEDCYYGLVCEILLDHEKKLKPEIFQSFSSFKVFPRTGKLPGTATPGDDIVIKDPRKEANKEQTPEEAKKERDDATNRHLDRIKQGLGKDWQIIEGKNFIAVTHAPAKFAREMMQHGELLRSWLEANLGFVGSGYTGKIIIRIFADRQEYDAFQTARRSYYWNSPEVITFKDKEGWDWDWHTESINRSIYGIWLRDKNANLAWSLPQWISWGLYDFVGRASVKSGRLVFRADLWENIEMKKLRRADDLMHVKDFFVTPSEALWARDRASTQTQFFVNFLLEGAGSRNPKYKNLLGDYLKNLIFLLDSEDTTPADPAAAKEPTSEAEEAEMVRKQLDSWRAKEQEHLDKLVEKTFTGWTDKDWDSFNAAYRQDLK